MATAVGVRVLPFITPLIARGLQKRFLLNASPLNIIVCENMIDADKYLEGLIRKNLDAAEAKHLKEKVGFVKASIGRMIPVQTPEMKQGNILRICSEKYGFLPVDKDAFIRKIPEIEGMVPLKNFNFYIQRKLFIHNMGHAVCAYLGLLLGDVYISDAASRPDVLFIAQNAMMESASALEKKFNVQLRDIVDHIRDLLCRFNNKALKDTCIRVGADIERKLGPKDRLTGAISCCKEQGVTAAFISIGAAAALHRYVEERRFDQMEDNASSILEKTSRLVRDSEEARLILDMYMKINQGDKLEKLARFALDVGKKAGVI
jgi:mannitol-1-phosphate 5-dehydrogenase